MEKKYKGAKENVKPSRKEKNDAQVRLHYQVYIQEEHSVHPKDVDEIEY